MQTAKLNDYLQDHFILFNSILTLLLAALYCAKGFQEKFTAGTWIIVFLNLIYVPCVLLLQEKAFSVFYLVYSTILIFLLAFEKTFLFNNFSALFIISIVILYNPKLELIALCFYFTATTIAFVLNEEKLVHFLIHLVRSIWFIQVYHYIIHDRHANNRLILNEDEKEILNQLCNGKIYQKEVEGFSENTIYRKLKAARERNGNISREELIEIYKKQSGYN